MYENVPLEKEILFGNCMFFQFSRILYRFATWTAKNRLGLWGGWGLGDFGGMRHDFISHAVPFHAIWHNKIHTFHLVHSSSIHSFAAISSSCCFIFYMSGIDLKSEFSLHLQCIPGPFFETHPIFITLEPHESTQDRYFADVGTHHEALLVRRVLEALGHSHLHPAKWQWL